MNPLTNVKNLAKINERELALGVAGDSSKSWHQKYKNSAWIYIGGIPYDLSEGDIIAVFSQYGEVVNINLIRDRKTGKSKGFCFLCFEDQRSTIMAVDNFNGIKLIGRVIRVDHVEEYRVPTIKGDMDADIVKIWEEGCAPQPLGPSSPLNTSEESEAEADAVAESARKEKKQLKKELKRERRELKRLKRLQKQQMPTLGLKEPKKEPEPAPTPAASGSQWKWGAEKPPEPDLPTYTQSKFDIKTGQFKWITLTGDPNEKREDEGFLQRKARKELELFKSKRYQ